MTPHAVVDSLSIPLAALGIVAALVAAGVAYSRKFTRDLAAVKETVLREFGFTDRNPRGIRPQWSGTVEGLRVEVDVFFAAYSSGYEGGAKRPYTRVRVFLKEDTRLLVRPRAIRYDKKPEDLECPTGDSAFDRRYAVHAPDGLAIAEILTDKVRHAFMRAQTPVALEGNTVYWIHPKHVREPKRMLEAIAACAAVAARIA